jgi:hypothetical protein
MEPITPPVSKEKLLKELTPGKFLRNTRKGNKEIYVFTSNDSPNLMIEVARLREVSFREAGGGTGKSNDLDHYDVSQNPYKQLIVWDRDAKEIVGGYRYAVCSRHMSTSSALPDLSMSDYFQFSDTFQKVYLPRSIELGRAWIQPLYQATNICSRYIYALDNLWDGLGGLINLNNDVDYFYGKITLFPNYNLQARRILFWFLNHYFHDQENLMQPIRKVANVEGVDYRKLGFSGDDYRSDLKVLSRVLKIFGEIIPPLVSAYLNLTSKIKIFGTVHCPDFGNTLETGIMLRIKDIEADKLKRYTEDLRGEEKRVKV